MDKIKQINELRENLNKLKAIRGKNESKAFELKMLINHSDKENRNLENILADINDMQRENVFVTPFVLVSLYTSSIYSDSVKYGYLILGTITCIYLLLSYKYLKNYRDFEQTNIIRNELLDQVDEAKEKINKIYIENRGLDDAIEDVNKKILELTD